MILRHPMKLLHSLLGAALALAPAAAAQIPDLPAGGEPPSAEDLEAARQAELEAARAARAERLAELRTAEFEAAEARPADPVDASAALDQALEAFGRGEPFVAEWALGRGLEQLETSAGEQTEANRALLEFARGALLAEHAADWLQNLDPASVDPIDVELALEREVQAADAFDTALSLGGNTEIGRRAAYDLGALRCRTSERLFRGVLSQAMLNGDGQSPLSFPEDSPERAALEAAADGFREAREVLVGRLKVDATHADTRANLEWAQRRLREIERLLETEPPEEEEQEQEDEEDSSEDEQEESEDEESEDSESEDSESEDSDSEDSESEDSEESEDQQESESESSEGEQESEQEQEPSEPSEGDVPEPEQQPAPSQEEAGESPDQQAAEVEEVEMSQEEMARLFDRLAEIEAAREALRAELARSRRVPVERDW